MLLYFKRVFVFLLILSFAHLPLRTFAQEGRLVPRSFAPDQAEDEEDLNRELWEYVRKTPYEEMLRYVAAAQRASQAKMPTEEVLPNGWKLSPAGTQIEVGRLPYEAILYADHLVVLNNGYYTKEPQEISVINPATQRIVKTLKANSIFPSAQVGLDGDLYISGGYDQKVYRYNRQFELVREYPVQGFAGLLVALDSSHIALAYLATAKPTGEYTQGKLALLNTTSGSIERETVVGYFPYSLSLINNQLYLNLLGENRLLIYRRNFSEVKSLEVGAAPQAMCSDSRRLFIVNSNSDNLTVVDTRTNKIRKPINLHERGSRFGGAPTSCAADAKYLYVTMAGTNTVMMVDKNTGRTTGRIPVGWYPTKVVSDRQHLYVVNAKGIRTRRPNIEGPQPDPKKGGNQYVLTLLKGSVSVIPKNEFAQQRSRWASEVTSGAPSFQTGNAFLPPIKHIFYIIKENRTFDQVLGDLSRANGDPSLTIFGKDITPNHHRLAEEFVTLDSYFADGEISVLGHSFTTSGYASPFLEWLGNAAYSGRYKGYPFGTVPVVYSPAYLWDNLDQRNVSYRIYGEPYYLFTRTYRLILENFGRESELARKFYGQTMDLAAKTDRGKAFFQLARTYYGQAETVPSALKLLQNQEFTGALSRILVGDHSLVEALENNDKFRRAFAACLARYTFNYSPWDLKHSDLDRAAAWRDNFRRQLDSGSVPQFNYMWLPNDHTAGSDSSFLSPYQFVAQNDAALGFIVETISRSPIWRNSLILIEEDDAQNGPDHVDATRTIAFAIGPYVKRNAVINTRYDQLSMLRTIGLLFDLNSLNLNEMMAVPMTDVFTSHPDFRPYDKAEPSATLASDDRERYKGFINSSR